MSSGVATRTTHGVEGTANNLGGVQVSAPCVVDSGDMAWMLIATVLVLQMFPGLAFFQLGLLRKKNTISVLAQIFCGLPLLSTMWVMIGYSLTFGPDIGSVGILGNASDAFLASLTFNACWQGSRIPTALYALFQGMFACITPLLMTGAFAERLAWKPFVLLTCLWEIFVYYPVAHWVWHPHGWLANLGAQDFAGGIVIHTTAGVSSLVACVVLGKRHGYDKNKGNFPYSNLPMACVGAASLWTGWFGFNGGSALGANSVAVHAVFNSQIAASVCATGMLLVTYYKTNTPSTIVMVNGVIAGLAGVTPASGYITPVSAFVLGLLLALSVEVGEWVLKKKLVIDDALDVSVVHGVTGLVGSLFIGIAGDKSVNPGGANGVVSSGGASWRLFGVQLLAVCVCAAWAGVVTFVILKLVQKRTPLRVSHKHELKGLDAAIHQETASVANESLAGSFVQDSRTASFVHARIDTPPGTFVHPTQILGGPGPGVVSTDAEPTQILGGPGGLTQINSTSAFLAPTRSSDVSSVRPNESSGLLPQSPVITPSTSVRGLAAGQKSGVSQVYCTTPSAMGAVRQQPQVPMSRPDTSTVGLESGWVGRGELNEAAFSSDDSDMSDDPNVLCDIRPSESAAQFEKKEKRIRKQRQQRSAAPSVGARSFADSGSHAGSFIGATPPGTSSLLAGPGSVQHRFQNPASQSAAQSAGLSPSTGSRTGDTGVSPLGTFLLGAGGEPPMILGGAGPGFVPRMHNTNAESEHPSRRSTNVSFEDGARLSAETMASGRAVHLTAPSKLQQPSSAVTPATPPLTVRTPPSLSGWAGKEPTTQLQLHTINSSTDAPPSRVSAAGSSSTAGLPLRSWSSGGEDEAAFLSDDSDVSDDPNVLSDIRPSESDVRHRKQEKADQKQRQQHGRVRGGQNSAPESGGQSPGSREGSLDSAILPMQGRGAAEE